MKAWYYSKTLWYAVISVVIGILAYLKGNIEAGTMITGNGLIVAFLRILTTTNITLKNE